MRLMVYENSAGFAHYTFELCNALTNVDDSNELIYVTSDSNRYSNRLNSNVKYLPILKSYKKKYKKNTVLWAIERFGISLWNIIKRNKLVKEFSPNIISIQCTIPLIDQYLLKNIKKYTKIVLTVHDVIVPQKSKSWSLRSLKKIYTIADKIIVHSETNKKQLMDIYGINESKIFVIHHGVHEKYNKLNVIDCKKEVRVDNGKPTILFYGAIRASKGLDILIKSLKGIKCNLVIAGSMPFGETFDKYEQLLLENKIDCRKYIEYISDEFSEVLFQACDIVALPYKYFYSQSGVFMEALQYRKPIIATDVSSFKEYINKYNVGKWCKANDVEDLHNKINDMLNNVQDMRIFQQNTEKAVRDNSWIKSAELHNRLFKNLL